MPPWCPNCCHFGVNGFGDGQETSRRLYWRWRPATDRPPRRRTAMTRTRIALLPGLLLTLALAVAACGGGAGKSDGVASLGGADSATSTTAAGGGDDRQKALNWARCMRQHGINLPDPSFDAQGRVVPPEPPALGDAAKRKYGAAEQACRQYETSGGPPPHPPSAQERQQALAFARCVRQHGINVPDPQITADGIYQPLPEGMERDDPRLRAPRQACEQFLPPHERGGGGR
jgi:hypothetical protein